MKTDENDVPIEWVERVRELMEDNGLKTYQDLAFKSGVSSGSLNQAMRGRHMPKHVTIDKIANALDSNSQYILYGNNTKEIQKIPIFKDADSILSWVDGDDLDVNSCKWVEPSGIKLSTTGFAISFSQNDMKPMFLPRDVILFEPSCNGQERPDIKCDEDRFVLVIDSHRNMMFGRYAMTLNGAFLEPVDTQFEPIKLKNTDVIVGDAIQQIRKLKTK